VVDQVGEAPFELEDVGGSAAGRLHGGADPSRGADDDDDGDEIVS